MAVKGGWGLAARRPPDGPRYTLGHRALLSHVPRGVGAFLGDWRTRWKDIPGAVPGASDGTVILAVFSA
jgi:hypothetical protein